MSRFMDLVIEAYDNETDYRLSCAKYRKSHGYCAYIDMNAGLDAEKQHIIFAEKWSNSSDETVRGIMDVLNMDTDQRARAYASARALKRWYVMTQWERLPSGDLIDRITEWIFA